MNQHYYNSITFSSHPKGKNVQQPTNGSSSSGGETSPEWYLLKEFSLCQISTGCPASGFFAESMPRENKIMLLISPGSSSFHPAAFPLQARAVNF